MDPMDEAQLALEQAEKNVEKFTWALSKVGFQVPEGPRQAAGRAYDGVLYAPPLIVRMSGSMSKRFYNQAAAKLNGRAVPRGGRS